MSDEVNMGRHILVSGLPKNVTPEKRNMFLKHMNKKVAEVLGHAEFNIQLIMDDDGLVIGAFLSFTKVADAEDALPRLNMYHFTRTDVLSAYRWSMLEMAKARDEEYKAPEIDKEMDMELVNTMCEDSLVRPQFLLKSGESHDVEWYWFDYNQNKPDLFKKPRVLKNDSLGQWSEMDRRLKLQPGLVHGVLPNVRPLPAWSTYGTMVVSQHSSGLKIWGGRQMNLMFEVNSPDVRAFLISPQEKYLVVKTTMDLSVWEIRTARLIRTVGNLQLNADDKWPVTRFSSDDSLIVVCQSGNKAGDSGKLYIYNSDTMRVVQASEQAVSYTFLTEGLQTAEWNPVGNTQLAVVTRGTGVQGWKVIIQNISIEDNMAVADTLIQRNFVQAERLDLLWHPKGTHLAVKVTKKSGTEYVLFNVVSKIVAAYQVQVDPGFAAGRFAWQPSGPNFAVIFDRLSKGAALGVQSELRIYSIKKNLKLLGKFDTNATHLFWSPSGTRVVAANYGKSYIAFFSLNDKGIVAPLEKCTALVTDSQWDPTGRFYATWVSCLKISTDVHYRIFDVNGRELYRNNVPKLSHLTWRPLPPSLMSDEELKEIHDNMKSINQRYRDEEERLQKQQEQESQKIIKEKESKYTHRMNAIAKFQEEKGYAVRRAELIASAPSARLWKRRLAALPEAEKTVHQDVTEEKIERRRLLS